MILRIEVPAPAVGRSVYLQMAKRAHSTGPWSAARPPATSMVASGVTFAARSADLMLPGAEPLEHNAYKLPLAQTLIRRAPARPTA